MEKLTQKWAVIALLEDAAEGSEFYYTDFPLHVTLAGVFASSKTGQQLGSELAELLQDQAPVEVTADHKDMFGPEQNIPVMRIQKSPELMELYQRVYQWLESSGAQYNQPEYQGQGYAPHSTFQKDVALAEGETRKLTSVSLIDLFPNGDGYQRKIARTISL